jgi:hypothetical protein
MYIEMPTDNIPWVRIAASETEDPLANRTNEWMGYKAQDGDARSPEILQRVNSLAVAMVVD